MAATASSLLKRRAENLVLFLVVNVSFLVFFEIFSIDRRNDSAPGYFRMPPPPATKFFVDDSVRTRPKQRRLINLDDFRYVTNSNACECQQTRCTPILVHSHAGHFDRRLAIRRSYPRPVLNQLGFRYVFMAGLPDRADVQARLLRESSRYGDVVQGNFREAYRNLTYKHVMGLTWFAERCRWSAHAVKMDDDVTVNAYALGHVLARDDELAGCVIPRAEPVRDPSNKWYVTRTEYAGDSYPPFLSGWLYAVRATVVRRLLHTVRPGEPYFWIDDVYVTGTLAARARIQLTDLRSDFETDPGPAYCCVRNRQRCGFLAAPVGDDLDLLRLYPDQLTRCRATNASCDAFRKSKFHHPCLDLWKKNRVTSQRTGKPRISITAHENRKSKRTAKNVWRYEFSTTNVDTSSGRIFNQKDDITKTKGQRFYQVYDYVLKNFHIDTAIACMNNKNTEPMFVQKCLEAWREHLKKTTELNSFKVWDLNIKD